MSRAEFIKFSPVIKLFGNWLTFLLRTPNYEGKRERADLPDRRRAATKADFEKSKLMRLFGNLPCHISEG
jgi:hypothetical protein